MPDTGDDQGGEGDGVTRVVGRAAAQTRSSGARDVADLRGVQTLLVSEGYERAV